MLLYDVNERISAFNDLIREAIRDEGRRRGGLNSRAWRGRRVNAEGVNRLGRNADSCSENAPTMDVIGRDLAQRAVRPLLRTMCSVRFTVVTRVVCLLFLFFGNFYFPLTMMTELLARQGPVCRQN